MLSANRSFQAQNSTCSTLLQTMLLHEICIVLSRKCLWDVNKDFWHEWRRLVVTTLSARAIYRQIPVSYLQIWYIIHVTLTRFLFVISRDNKDNRKRHSFLHSVCPFQMSICDYLCKYQKCEKCFRWRLLNFMGELNEIFPFFLHSYSKKFKCQCNFFKCNIYTFL